MPEIIKKPNKFKKNLFERTPEGKPIEKITLEGKRIRKKLELNFKERQSSGFKHFQIISAKFLAKEVYITEAFINRLSKQTSRKIIIIPLENTGLIYPISIKENNKIKLLPLRYSSTAGHTNKEKIELEKIIVKNKSNLLVFIDASKQNIMPSALVGSRKDKRHTKPRDSINGILKSKGLRTAIANYDWARGGNGTKGDYLPKYTKEQLNKTDAILFNPSKKVDKYLSTYEEGWTDIKKWEAAPHDDDYLLRTKEYKDIVLHFVNQMKKSYEKRLKNEPKRKN